MKVVVTGANSFLAGHLIRVLAGQRANVFGTYRTDDHRIQRLRDIRGVQLVQLDLGESRGFESLPTEADALVHVAAASVSRSGSISEFIASNVIGSQNVARYALSAGIRKMVYTSTVSIYGDISVPVLAETSPIINPDDYGLTKYLAERVFAETSDLACVALRLPGILGKGAHRAWIPSLIERVLQGQRKARIYNSTSLFNNAVHVEEISKFIWSLLNGPMSGFNALTVAADGQMTIQEVINLITDMLGESIETIEVPSPKPSFTISSDCAKKFGYETRPIKEILRCYFEEAGLGTERAQKVD